MPPFDDNVRDAPFERYLREGSDRDEAERAPRTDDAPPQREL